MRRIVKVTYDQLVYIDKATLDLVRQHAEARGRSVSSIMREALCDWLTTIGTARLEHDQEAAQYRPSDKVIPINAARSALRA